MSTALQWIITGIILAGALAYAIAYARRSAKDPCHGCTIAHQCKKKSVNCNKPESRK